jgi:hypothetical protein
VEEAKQALDAVLTLSPEEHATVYVRAEVLRAILSRAMRPHD